MAVFSARTADAGDIARDFSVAAASAAGLGCGFLILLGWEFDVALLKSGLPGHSATQPLTAVCFCLCSLGLGLSAVARPAYRYLTNLCALLVLAVVAATLWQNALDADWGLDRLLFPDAVLHEQPGQYLRPGRGAGATLIAVALLGLCLLLVHSRAALANRLYVLFATLGLLFSATVMLAYLFGLPALYAMGLYAQVSLSSGVTLGVLFVGALFRRADLGWMRVLTGDTVGAASGRRLLWWSVSLLIVLACVVKLGSAHDLYGAEFDATLLTLAAVGLLFAGVVWHVERIDALEGARRSVAHRLRSAQDELIHSGRSKDAFLAVLAHELRNPLASLRNGVEIIRRTGGQDRLTAHTAEIMARQMQQLIALIDDLLDLGRLAQGTLELNRNRVLLKDVVTRAIDDCRVSIATCGHELICVPGGDDLAVHGDLPRLVQVLSSVLGYSARYIEPGGRILVAITHDGPHVSLRVSDTGSGIPQQGVGLELIRRLIELHGGSVAAHGLGPGMGSTFVIRLPSAS